MGYHPRTDAPKLYPNTTTEMHDGSSRVMDVAYPPQGAPTPWTPPVAPRKPYLRLISRNSRLTR
jgi:hypothetical protein